MDITLDDISQVSLLMGRNFSDVERIAALQYKESCDIQACPGSGKTTTMVAKIVILAQKFSGTNYGICALSHTNAAREEVEKSLGPYVSMLFKFPNFISTIQVFTDTFLAVPAFVEQYGKRPVVIDDETYEEKAKKRFSHLPHKTQFYLDHQTGNAGAEYFANISYAFEDQKLVYFDGQDEQPFLAAETTASYKDVLRLKEIMIAEGYLTYHDAFSFAHRYIKKYPNLSATLSHRFPFVFIDEMQDTDKYQLRLVEMIFAGRSTLQKFGDPNQAIYGHKSNNFQQVWVPINPLPIRSSRRLSRSIAHLSENLGVRPQPILGNPENPNHSHTIILYGHHNINSVIPTFGEIIHEAGLVIGPFVALGAVGKLNENPDHTSIASYWPSFVNHRRINRISLSFWDTIFLANTAIRQDRNFMKAREILLQGISFILREQGFVTQSKINFTAQILQREVDKAGVESSLMLNRILLRWCLTLLKGNQLDILQIINDLDEVLGLLGFNLVQQKKDELEEEYENHPLLADIPQSITYNQYHHDDNIQITIDTIHSAKGRTHQATLLLETFYYRFDIKQIIPYLHGVRLNKPGLRVTNRYLPLAYVACTRPTHLLCLAIHRDHVSDKEQLLLEQYGWAIKDLTE